MSQRQPYLSELPTAIRLPPEPHQLTRELASSIFSAASLDDHVRSLRTLSRLSAQQSAPHAHDHRTASAARLEKAAANGQ